MKKKVTIYTIVLMVVAIVFGVCQSINQVYTGKLVSNFQYRVFAMLIITNIGFVVFNCLQRIFCKSLYCMIDNQYKLKLMSRVLDSKISAISTVSVGKINETVGKLSALRAEITVTTIASVQPLVMWLVMVARLSAHPLSVLILVLGMTVSGLMFFFGNRIFKYDDKEKESRNGFVSIAVDGFLNLKTLKYCDKRSYIMGRLEEAEKEAYKYSVSVLKRVWETAALAVNIAAVLLIAWIFRGNQEMLAYILVSEWIVYNMTDRVTIIIDDLVQFHSNKKEIASLDGTDNREKTPMPKSIPVYGNFGYENSSMFCIEDFSILRCERYLVTGESGQGKSSFANLLVGAMPIADMKKTNIETFYVYQETECLNDTLRNNISFGDKTISDEEMIALIKELKMGNWFESLEEGLDTVIGERGCKLSSGLKQRVNILRTVLEMRRNPNKLFILDEITSNLDEETKNTAIEVLDRECHSTLIVISHNEGFDRIINNHITVEDHVVRLMK